VSCCVIGCAAGRVCQPGAAGRAAERGWSWFWRGGRSRHLRCRTGQWRSACHLRSTRVGLHVAVRTRDVLGRRSFFIAAPVVWELTAASPSLPVHQSQSVSSRAQDSSFQAAAFHCWLCPLRTIEEIELHWMVKVVWLNDSSSSVDDDASIIG